MMSTQPVPENLFDAIGKLVKPERREYFYQRMLYFRHLRPEDEMLRIAEAMGFLALVIGEAPQEMAREREQLAEILTRFMESLQVAYQASVQYHQQLEERLSKLPAEIAEGINAEAIAAKLSERLRQQFLKPAYDHGAWGGYRCARRRFVMARRSSRRCWTNSGIRRTEPAAGEQGARVDEGRLGERCGSRARTDERSGKGIVADHRRPLFWSPGHRGLHRHAVPALARLTRAAITAVHAGGSIGAAAIFLYYAPAES